MDLADMSPERDLSQGDQRISLPSWRERFEARRILRASGAGRAPKGGVISRGAPF